MSGLGRILARAGTPARVFEQGESRDTRLLLSPMPGTSGSGREMTPLGQRDTRRWLAILPPEALVSPHRGCRLLCGGQEYEVLRAELFSPEGESSHWEALLERREEAWDGGA